MIKETKKKKKERRLRKLFVKVYRLYSFINLPNNNIPIRDYVTPSLVFSLLFQQELAVERRMNVTARHRDV